MTGHVEREGLQVAAVLCDFLEQDVLPGTGLEPASFWRDLAALFRRLGPENAALLAEREELQARLDDWHDRHRGQPFDAVAYRAFLDEIGYLVPEPEPFVIGTSDVDDEIARLAGPQLVVPVLNDRFLLNAANARWGSLYDALYGTDALAPLPAAGRPDPDRAALVVQHVRDFLDATAPLAHGSWKDWDGGRPDLADPSQLKGLRGDDILLVHNRLHIEIRVDRAHPLGRVDRAGIADVIVEAALTTIVDFEDSVAAVDADDKTTAYANWLGLMRGDLTASFAKGGETVRRELAPDRDWVAPDGSPFTLPGRSLLLVRNVGHLMTTPAIILPDGTEAPEGILDAVVTSAIALHDLRGAGRFRNGAAGAIYIVKPKMHGPRECAFSDRLFDAVEDMLGLSRHTIRIGVMDEERRTSANLASCIHAVRGRVAFINTGFLDRTGDEIHTSMRAGAMMRKADMKAAPWLGAYEDRNVRIGLACGFGGRAQIGKGMWAAPDRMGDMLAQKGAHPRAGATTAWVPSPTAASLHALHYHEVDVFERQAAIAREPVPALDRLLAIPLAHGHNWSTEEVDRELDNNAQGILGYVVRWIDQGIGCSKVPDIDDVGLMEDRATLRISSQHMANWLLHGVCTEADVDAALSRMAAIVDGQNAGDPAYRPLIGADGAGIAFQAARSLILEGAAQPGGYTEPLLHAYRRQAKRAA